MLKTQIRLTASVLGFGLALLLLSGCASKPPQVIEVSAKPVERPQLILPEPDVIRARNIEWIIITPENAEQVFEDARKKGNAIAFFALTDKGYENLALNLSDVRAFIQQQKAIIIAYENYYLKSEEAIEQANREINSINNKSQQQENKPSLLRRINPFD